VEEKTVLLVDDDMAILSLYSTVLQMAGFNVIAKSSAIDALDTIESDQDIDLVVTDILMAQMDGWQFLTYIRVTLGLDEVALPVIVLSAVDGTKLKWDVMKYRANDWLTKPVTPVSRLAKHAVRLLGLHIPADG